MNTNPKAIRILCYGDSNTWGHIPGTSQRYSADVRWPGVLQNIMGQDFEVIEEGLGGRTTSLEDTERNRAGRNGLTYLIPCLNSHNPLDVVVLFLGTNDLKDRYNQSATDIAGSIQSLIRSIKEFGVNKDGQPSIIILLSPPFPNKNVVDKYKELAEKVPLLSEKFFEVAKKENCEFIDLAKYIESSTIDGVHLEVNGHRKIAALVAEVIINQTNSK